MSNSLNFTNKLCVFFLTTITEYHTGTLKVAIETFLKKCKSKYAFDLLIYFDVDHISHHPVYNLSSTLESKYENLNKIIIIFNEIPEKENFYIKSNNRDINLDEFPMGATHGVNRHFYMTLSDLFTRSYDNFLLLESDTIPLKDDWFDVAYNFIDTESPYQPFLIAGSKYKGSNREFVNKQYYANHLNGVAIYKNCKNLKNDLEHSRLYLIESLKKEPKKYYNFMNFDVAIDLYFQHIQLSNLLVDTDFICNVSDIQSRHLTIEEVVREFPETRILHKKDLYCDKQILFD
jgi:hypothetical protein